MKNFSKAGGIRRPSRFRDSRLCEEFVKYAYLTPNVAEHFRQACAELSEMHSGVASSSGGAEGSFQPTKTSPEAAKAREDTPQIRAFMDFLEQAGLSGFASQFEANGWDEMAVLPEMTDEDLRGVGLKAGHMRKFKLALSTWQAAAKDLVPTAISDGSGGSWDVAGSSKDGEKKERSADEGLKQKAIPGMVPGTPAEQEAIPGMNPAIKKPDMSEKEEGSTDVNAARAKINKTDEDN